MESLLRIPFDVESGEASQSALPGDGSKVRTWLCSTLGEQLDPKFQFSMCYCASSFAFTLVGLVQFAVPPEHLLPSWPWRFEAALLVQQGFLSYLADVHYFQVSSRWHVADRVSACFLTATLVSKLPLGVFPVEDCVVMLCAVVCGLSCFAASSAARLRGDLARRFLWHTLWHLAMPAASIFVLCKLELERRSTLLLPAAAE